MGLADTQVQDDDARQRARELSQPGEAPPAVVPGYQIIRRVGTGNYGSVWLAREQNTGKHVAIKFYLHRRGIDWTLLSREVEKLAVLYTSRYIVRLVAVGWEHDPPFYVMEYLENGSLAQRLEHGTLTASEAVRIATHIAQALVHAHGSGILHCDLKPANVLLDQDWEPRLCDFGQSRLLEEDRHALGTLFYMAPEQADTKAIPDARWDVYALGALLYQMLCGEPPYRTETAERELQAAGNLEARLERYRNLVRTESRPIQHRRTSGVDPLLTDIIDRCLAIDSQRRFPNAQAVLDRLTARERQRARRPLVFMGLVLPFLLVLGLLPFALDALRDAITTSRSNIVRRALESDVLSANLLSTALDQELQRRLDELVTLASDNDIRRAITDYIGRPMDQRGPLSEVLEHRLAPIQARITAAGRAEDASWFVQDPMGFQRWRYPASETVDRRYACRDYFHGRNVDYSEKNCPDDLRPLQAQHISVPYLSTTTNRYVVALSVPVFAITDDNSNEPPVVMAVLARTLYLSQLLHDYESSLRAQGAATGRTMALLDTRTWSLVAHDWMNDDHLDETGDPMRWLKVEPRVIETLQDLVPGPEAKASDLRDRLDDYLDPVGSIAPEKYGGEWLAAFSPVGRTGWIAVVQEPREPVLRPVENLRTRLMWSGVGGILLVCAIVAACWWMIVVLMNERGQRWLARWRRSGTVTTLPPLTGKASEHA